MKVIIQNECNQFVTCKEVIKPVVNTGTKIIVNVTNSTVKTLSGGQSELNRDVVAQVNKPNGTTDTIKAVVNGKGGDKIKEVVQNPV